MSKKVRIGNKWVIVDDADVKEGDSDESEEDEAEETSTASDDADAGADDDADEGGEGEKSLKQESQRIARSMVQEIKKSLGAEDIGGMRKQLDRLIENSFGNDSKLKQILGGKDIYAKDELTKEEKIVGFFHALVTNNEVAVKALAEGVDADGGYLFPKEFLNELVRELPNQNVMRNYVRIIPMRRNKMDITNLISGPKVTWTAENVAKSTTTARFGQSTLVARKVAAILYSSDELIEDSDIFDVVQMIIQLFAEAIAEEEERVIWAGNNTTEPQGINAAGTVPTVATSGVGDFDDIIAVYRALPRKYRTNAAWFMNDNTAAQVEKLKDSNGQYIWQPSAVEGQPDRLRGKPVVIVDWVPDRSIFFGDMKRAYFLGDRKRMTVKVSQDTETAFTKDQTAIRVVHRIGGLVVLPNAARELTNF